MNFCFNILKTITLSPKITKYTKFYFTFGYIQIFIQYHLFPSEINLVSLAYNFNCHYFFYFFLIASINFRIPFIFEGLFCSLDLFYIKVYHKISKILFLWRKMYLFEHHQNIYHTEKQHNEHDPFALWGDLKTVILLV